MRRRAFLGVVGCTATVGLAGCLDDGMELEVTELFHPTFHPVHHAEKDGMEYTVIFENTGTAGLGRFELFYFEDSSTPDPQHSAVFGGDDDPARTFDTAETISFDSDETKDVTISGTEANPPGEDYGIFPMPASYGGVIENNGGSGEMEVEFTINESAGHDVEEPDSKIREIDSDSRTEVEFEVLVPAGASYQIRATPL